MNTALDGNAIVYCEGAFNTTNGKTAHGLVRFTRRYKVLSVIDSRLAGKDAGEILDAKPNGIPVVASLEQALERASENPATHFVMGLAPDGGRLPPKGRDDVRKALQSGLNVDSGLHDFLSDDEAMVKIARDRGVTIRDVRKPPSRDSLHFFSGKIEKVKSFKVALLGTDSAVGKRTTAWILVKAFQAAGIEAEMIGTGQTAWMQGARYGVIMDSLVNDFVSGEIEHAVYSAWENEKPAAMVIEGQGSLMNPAYPGGFEILAAGRPDVIVLQHAPARVDYDGFEGYPIHGLWKQIQVAEMLSGKPVAAITLNHEQLNPADIPLICSGMEKAIGLPVTDALIEGGHRLVDALKRYMKQ